jgi:hypothetical protein
VLTRKQKLTIGIATSLPFVIMLYLNLISPNYASQFFISAYLPCAGPMLLVLLLSLLLVPVSLRGAFLQLNKHKLKVSEDKASYKTRLGYYGLAVLGICFLCVATYLVLMGPAILQAIYSQPLSR